MSINRFHVIESGGMSGYCARSNVIDSPSWQSSTRTLAASTVRKLVTDVKRYSDGMSTVDDTTDDNGIRTVTARRWFAGVENYRRIVIAPAGAR